jgi:heme exporter protein D
MAEAPLPNNTDARFWRTMRALLIVAIVASAAWAIQMGLSDEMAKGSIGFLLGIVVWVGALALCALLFMTISLAQDLLQTLAAMWRPLVFILLAAFLLFFNDQGRELGVSLMIDDDGWWRFVYLFFALVYWGLNNWNSARLGLRDALDEGLLGMPPKHPSREKPNRHVVAGDERWLFWLPRLIGVCAHLFAAINLSMAALRQPDFGSDRLRLVAFTAPLAIVLFTVLVYVFDRLWLSERAAGTSGERSPLASISALIVAILLLAVIAVFAFTVHSVPSGFLWGTFTISLSAVAFLIVISVLRRHAPLGAGASEEQRRADDQKDARTFAHWTVSLFAVAVLIALIVWISPTLAGRSLGSMVIAYFALGALLATLNMFALGVAKAMEWKQGWFGGTVRPRVFGTCVVAAVIALGFLNAWLHPFHRVRLCDGVDCVVPSSVPSFPTSPDARPSVEAAAKLWYAQALAAYARLHGDKMPDGDELPMLIVATAGGGIRAAYWTAAVLERIESELAAKGGMRPYLFAISGVSGGSVGATAFDAALTMRDEKRLCGAGADPCPSATSFLTEDFLAPALASWIFTDTPSSFLPDLRQNDRGTALEQGFEHASRGLLSRPFLSFFPYKGDTGQTEDTGQAGAPRPPWRPVLLLNATHLETGKRIITGHVLIERDVFIDSLDALHLLGNDVRASTAAHNSARFSYISPAGDLGNRNGSVIDGGYFENYGALSALEIARAAQAALKDEKPRVKLVILMISSDPDLDKANGLVRIDEAKDGGPCLVSTTEPDPPSRNASVPQNPSPPPNYLPVNREQVLNAWLNEFAAPLQGIKNVREAHGNRAAAELAVKVCAEYPEAPKAAAEGSSGTESQQTRVAETANRGKTANLDQPVLAKARPHEPYFAHIAMCRHDSQGAIKVDPPLGWLLSKATRKGLDELLDRCGNDTQRKQLEAALAKPEQQRAAVPSRAN